MPMQTQPPVAAYANSQKHTPTEDKSFEVELKPW